jgi:hypothetical protein
VEPREGERAARRCLEHAHEASLELGGVHRRAR